MTGNQCDNCRKFAGSPAIGWLALGVIAEATTVFGTPSSGLETVGTFCSKECVIEYLYVMLAAERERE